MKAPASITRPAGARPLWRSLVFLLLAALVPVGLLWRGALLQGVFFQADLVVYYLPAYTYATRVLRTGMLPLWAPEMEGGQPFHAQWEPTLLYPVDVPFRFLMPPWWALNLSLIFHYVLAAAAMFLYARRLSLSAPASLVSAAIYAINGFMVAHLEHPNLIVGAAWLPLLLLALDVGLEGRTLAGALGMGAVLGMLLLGGHPDIFLMGTLLVGLTLLAHPFQGILRARRLRGALRPLALVVGGYGLGLALAAAQLLPTLGLALMAWSERGASVAYQTTWSLRPEQFLVQLLPDFFGRNGQDTYWGMAHYWEESSYVGSLALALAITGLLSRHRLAGFYGGVAVLAAWLAMGTHGLAFSLLREVPAFGTMRLPCRYMFLFDLSMAVLAGCGTHWLGRVERPAELSRARWLRGFATLLLGGVTVWLLAWWVGRERLLAVVASAIGEKHRFHAPDWSPLLRQYAAQFGANAALLLGGLALALLVVLLATRSGPGRRAVPWVAWAGVATTLGLSGYGYHTLIPARLVVEEPFTVAAIRETAPPGPFRVLQWDWNKLHSDVAVHRGFWPTDAHGYRQYIAALPGNYNLVWGLSSVRQEEWSALPLSHTKRLTSGLLAMGDRQGFQTLLPYLAWWNAPFVLSQRRLRAAGLDLVMEDRTRLYRAVNSGQRAWIVHEAAVEPDERRLIQRLAVEPGELTERVLFLDAPPTPTRARKGRARVGVGVGADGEALSAPESARIVSRTSTRALVEAVAERDGYLVIGESWAPGWRAWVDGRAAPILRANYVHRAVPILAGRHRVEFRYLPSDFRFGLYVSGLALAMLLALVVGRVGGRV
jgi:hypothetical protein